MPKEKGTVLYVGGFELPDKNAAAHRVVNNAKIFRELGYRVVFCGVSRETASPAETAQKVFGFDSFPIPYPSGTGQWIKQMLNIGPYSHLIERYPDVKLVVCYNLHAAPLAKLERLCRKRKIRIIADCTEWYENRFSLSPVRLIKCVDTALAMRVYQKRCDGMIAISRYLADYYKKSVKTIITVPPLVDLRDEKFAFASPKPENAVPTFAYCGSPSASKEALGEVVKAFHGITDMAFRLIIAGLTKEQFSAMYGITVEDEKIEFLGRVSHEKALQVVRESDYAIIIRPATRATSAGFPTKFAEAISVGTAVVANDTSDLKAYLKNGKNGYLVDTATLEADLRGILASGTKPQVESSVFDYHNYIHLFDVLTENK